MLTGPGPRLVDLGNPVEWGHPLNRDLAGWWLPLPNVVGGFRVFDITGRGSHFPFDNTARWRGTQNAPPGFQTFGSVTAASWTLTGTGFGSLSQFNPTTGITVAGWSRILTDDDRAVMSKPTTGSTLQFSLVPRSSGRAEFNVNTTGSGAQSATSGNGFWATFQWNHFCGTWDAANGAQVYVNGILRATTAATGTLLTGSADPYIGSNPSTGNQMQGQIADLRLYANRRLKPDEVWALYEESGRGYPTALRRYTPAVWSFAVPAPVVRRPNLLLLGVG